MQKEIELKCLCDGLLNALRKMGLGKYSLRNYYYEGMWPLIKAYRKAGKELYDPVFRDEQNSIAKSELTQSLRSQQLICKLRATPKDAVKNCVKGVQLSNSGSSPQHFPTPVRVSAC